MDINPLKFGERAVIQAYGDGGFRVSGTRFQGSVIVLDDRIWPIEISQFSELDVSDFQPLLEAAAEVEILLLGCGTVPETLCPDHRGRLKDAGIAAEVMGTGAACRTFNLLQAEGRRVAALLVAVT